jgi:hypothetical protein
MYYELALKPAYCQNNSLILRFLLTLKLILYLRNRLYP